MKHSALASVDLNHLRALHALLEEANVTRAAERLGITPPAASNALRRLRDLLDDPLLVRSGRSMVRTPKADALRSSAAHFMAAAAALLHPAEFDPDTWEGSFPLLASDYVYAALAAPLEELLATHLPGARLAVSVPGSTDPEQWLRDCDGLVIDPFGERASRGFADPVYEERMVLVMPRGLGSVETVSLDAFCDYQHLLVSPRGQPGSIVDQRLKDLGRTRKVVRIVPTFFLAAHILAHSNLVSTLPERFAHVIAPRFNLTVHELPFATDAVQFWVSGHRRHAHSPLHHLMRSLIARAAEAGRTCAGRSDRSA